MYPSRLVKLFERDGTIYSLNMIPFGGFCRMRGEDDPSQSGSFAAASRWARTATLVAGPALNFVLAILLFAVLAMAQGVPDASRPGALVKTIVPDSPAALAGLQTGDRIFAANGQAIATPKDLQDLTKVNLGLPVVYRLARIDSQTRAEQTIEVTMTPRESAARPGRAGHRDRAGDQAGENLGGSLDGRPLHRRDHLHDIRHPGQPDPRGQAAQ